MHIEIQVALNFVISYLYNKLPRRRVNIFGEELEKALKEKFQGHWYPEKPFKGSAFRCVKTGDPVDAVLERAARESGVSIHDILENLPNELSVWVDPGEVSYRIGEKSQVKILYSESSDNHDENNSADREVNKTFNPEAVCFRPIDAINTSLNSLSLSPKNSPLSGCSPHSGSSSSPTFKSSPSGVTVGGSFMSRTQPPLTFTTATFAQTKFGSTKLKTSSKRSNSSYRMSPTEFSNYIKQRAIQQQQQHQYMQHNNSTMNQTPNHFGPIGPISPARSVSPNPLGLNLNQNNSNSDPFFFPHANGLGYQQMNGPRNIFENHFQQDALLNANGFSKFNSFLEPNSFYGLRNNHQTPQTQQSQISPIYPQQQQLHNNLNQKLKLANNILRNGHVSKSPTAPNEDKDLIMTSSLNKSSGITVTLSSAESDQEHQISPMAMEDASNSSKLHTDGLNSLYSNSPSSYQQLLVAN